MTDGPKYLHKEVAEHRILQMATEVADAMMDRNQNDRIAFLAGYASDVIKHVSEDCRRGKDGAPADPTDMLSTHVAYAILTATQVIATQSRDSMIQAAQCLIAASVADVRLQGIEKKRKP